MIWCDLVIWCDLIVPPSTFHTELEQKHQFVCRTRREKLHVADVETSRLAGQLQVRRLSVAHPACILVILCGTAPAALPVCISVCATWTWRPCPGAFGQTHTSRRKVALVLLAVLQAAEVRVREAHARLEEAERERQAAAEDAIDARSEVRCSFKWGGQRMPGRAQFCFHASCSDLRSRAGPLLGPMAGERAAHRMCPHRIHARLHRRPTRRRASWTTCGSGCLTRSAPRRRRAPRARRPTRCCARRAPRRGGSRRARRTRRASSRGCGRRRRRRLLPQGTTRRRARGGAGWGPKGGAEAWPGGLRAGKTLNPGTPLSVASTSEAPAAAPSGIIYVFYAPTHIPFWV